MIDTMEYSPSDLLPSMPNGMVLARDPISGTSPPDSDCRCTMESKIMGARALLALPNILGENHIRARRVLVAESLRQPMMALELPTACRSDLMPTEPLENVPACPQTAEPMENAPVFPPTENPLENFLVYPLSEVSLENAPVINYLNFLRSSSITVFEDNKLPWNTLFTTCITPIQSIFNKDIFMHLSQ